MIPARGQHLEIEVDIGSFDRLCRLDGGIMAVRIYFILLHRLACPFATRGPEVAPLYKTSSSNYQRQRHFQVEKSGVQPRRSLAKLTILMTFLCQLELDLQQERMNMLPCV